MIKDSRPIDVMPPTVTGSGPGPVFRPVSGSDGAGAGNNDGNGATGADAGSPAVAVPGKPAGQAAPGVAVPDEFKGSTGKELIEYLERKVAEYKPMSKEDLEKLRRKQRTQRLIGGISDAVRAVANLGFTTAYAPDMYKAGDGMSARMRERFEKEEAQRKARDEEFYNYALNLAKLREADAARGLDIWKYEQNMMRQDREHELKMRKEERDELMFQARYALQMGRLTEQGYRNAIAEIKADRMAELTDAQIARLNRTGTGHGKSGGTWYMVDPETNKVSAFHAASEAQAHSYAGAHGGLLIGSVTVRGDAAGNERGSTWTVSDGVNNPIGKEKKETKRKKNRFGL